MDMTEIVEGLRHHNVSCMLAFAERQGRDTIPALLEGSLLLHRTAYDAMLTDVDRFMAYKTPAVVPPIPSERLRSMLDAAVAGDQETLHALCQSLTLDELYALISFAQRFTTTLTNYPNAPRTAVAR